jgi:hypothetical protein
MATVYPTQVPINEDDVKKLAEFLKSAYGRIVAEIYDATDFGVANRKAILAQIEEILANLGEDMSKFADEVLTEYYKAGAGDAIIQLKNIDAEIQVASGFNKLHRDAIVALVDDTVAAFSESLTGVKRSAFRLLGEAVRSKLQQEIALGVVTGDALRKIRQNIKGVLQEEGLAAMVDKRGRSWALDAYSEMVFRTKAIEARNMGLANRMSENGYDLVQVSSHFGSCDLCAPWQGEILSTTGQTTGYPSLNDAMSDGLFHPNCRHAINALSPKLANITSAYDPTTGKYGTAGAGFRQNIEGKVAKTSILPAQKYQATFIKNVDTIAAEGDWVSYVGPVKKVDRATDKVVNDYNGNILALKDSNRAAIMIDNPFNPAEFDRIKAAVGKVYEIDTSASKNQLFADEGYAKAMINIKLPGGRLGEIQVTYPEMWDVKYKGGGDQLYEIVRSGQDKNGESLRKMEALYQAARKDAIARLGL